MGSGIVDISDKLEKIRACAFLILDNTVGTMKMVSECCDHILTAINTNGTSKIGRGNPTHNENNLSAWMHATFKSGLRSGDGELFKYEKHSSTSFTGVCGRLTCAIILEDGIIRVNDYHVTDFACFRQLVISLLAPPRLGG